MFGNKESQKRKCNNAATPNTSQNKRQRMSQSYRETTPNNKPPSERVAHSLSATVAPKKPLPDGSSPMKGTNSFLKSMDSIIFAVKSGKAPATPKRDGLSASVSETPKRIAKPSAATPIISPRPFSGKASRLVPGEKPTGVILTGKLPDGITSNTKPAANVAIAAIPVSMTPVKSSHSPIGKQESENLASPGGMGFTPLSSSTPMPNRKQPTKPSSEGPHPKLQPKRIAATSVNSKEGPQSNSEILQKKLAAMKLKLSEGSKAKSEGPKAKSEGPKAKPGPKPKRRESTPINKKSSRRKENSDLKQNSDGGNTAAENSVSLVDDSVEGKSVNEESSVHVQSKTILKSNDDMDISLINHDSESSIKLMEDQKTTLETPCKTNSLAKTRRRKVASKSSTEKGMSKTSSKSKKNVKSVAQPQFEISESNSENSLNAVEQTTDRTETPTKFNIDEDTMDKTENSSTLDIGEKTTGKTKTPAKLKGKTKTASKLSIGEQTTGKTKTPVKLKIDETETDETKITAKLNISQTEGSVLESASASKPSHSVITVEEKEHLSLDKDSTTIVKLSNRRTSKSDANDDPSCKNNSCVLDINSIIKISPVEGSDENLLEDKHDVVIIQSEKNSESNNKDKKSSSSKESIDENCVVNDSKDVVETISKQDSINVKLKGTKTGKRKSNVKNSAKEKTNLGSDKKEKGKLTQPNIKSWLNSSTSKKSVKHAENKDSDQDKNVISNVVTSQEIDLTYDKNDDIEIIQDSPALSSKSTSIEQSTYAETEEKTESLSKSVKGRTLKNKTTKSDLVENSKNNDEISEVLSKSINNKITKSAFLEKSEFNKMEVSSEFPKKSVKRRTLIKKNAKNISVEEPANTETVEISEVLSNSVNNTNTKSASAEKSEHISETYEKSELLSDSVQERTLSSKNAKHTFVDQSEHTHKVEKSVVLPKSAKGKTLSNKNVSQLLDDLTIIVPSKTKKVSNLLDKSNKTDGVKTVIDLGPVCKSLASKSSKNNKAEFTKLKAKPVREIDKNLDNVDAISIEDNSDIENSKLTAKAPENECNSVNNNIAASGDAESATLKLPDNLVINLDDSTGKAIPDESEAIVAAEHTSEMDHSKEKPSKQKGKRKVAIKLSKSSDKLKKTRGSDKFNKQLQVRVRRLSSCSVKKNLDGVKTKRRRSSSKTQSDLNLTDETENKPAEDSLSKDEVNKQISNKVEALPEMKSELEKSFTKPKQKPGRRSRKNSLEEIKSPETPASRTRGHALRSPPGKTVPTPVNNDKQTEAKVNKLLEIQEEKHVKTTSKCKGKGETSKQIEGKDGDLHEIQDETHIKSAPKGKGKDETDKVSESNNSIVDNSLNQKNSSAKKRRVRQSRTKLNADCAIVSEKGVTKDILKTTLPEIKDITQGEDVPSLKRRKVIGRRRLSLKQCSNKNGTNDEQTDSHEKKSILPNDKVKTKSGKNVSSAKLRNPVLGRRVLALRTKKTFETGEENISDNDSSLEVDDSSSPTVRKRGRRKSVKLNFDSEESDHVDRQKVVSDEENSIKSEPTDNNKIVNSSVNINLVNLKPTGEDNFLARGAIMNKCVVGIKKLKTEITVNKHDRQNIFEKNFKLPVENTEECELDISSVDISVLENIGDETLEELEKSVLSELPQKHLETSYVQSELEDVDVKVFDKKDSVLKEPLVFVCKICQDKWTGTGRLPTQFKLKARYNRHMRDIHQIYDYKGVNVKPKKKKSQGGIKMIEDEGGGSDISVLDSTEQEPGDQTRVEEDEKPQVEQAAEPRKRRRAATKAISKWKEAEMELQELKKAEKDMSSSVKYYKPNDQMPISKEAMEDIKKLKKIMNKDIMMVKCPFSDRGCNREYWHPMSIKAHIAVCKFGKRSLEYNGYQCSKCNYKVKIHMKMQKHIKTHDWPDDDLNSLSGGNDTDTDNDPDVDFDKPTKRKKDQQDHSSSDDGEYDEDDDDDFKDADGSSGASEPDYSGDESVMTERKPGQRIKSQNTVYSRESALHSMYMKDSQSFLVKMRSKIMNTPVGTEEPIADNPFNWTLEFLTENERKGLMPHMRTNKQDYKLLEQSEAVKYLPLSQKSVPFGFMKKKMASELKTLKLFESSQDAESISLYVGGPVWAMAWCPTPVATESNQYLAVYCHRDRNEWHSFRQAKGHTTILQIWDFGVMKNGASNVKPKLAYCLALDIGAVWDMVWCPTGCYDNGVQQKGTSQGVERIGELALACSAGYVQIISIPHPISIIPSQQTTTDASLPLVFQPQKCWRLVQNSLGGAEISCLCLDWQLKEDCSKIVAGFGDGSVSLWNIKTESKLLSRVGPQGDQVRLPYMTIQAHTDTVVGIQFCQRLPQYLFTASTDRDYKMWDLQSTSAPLETVAKGKSRCMCAPSNYVTTIVGYDDVFNWNTNTVTAYEPGYVERDHFSIFQIRSCAMGVSFNNWVNTLATCTTGGEVLINYLYLMIHFYKIRKRHFLRRLKLYTTQLTELTFEHKNNENQNGANSQNMENSKQGKSTQSSDGSNSKIVTETGEKNKQQVNNNEHVNITATDANTSLKESVIEESEENLDTKSEEKSTTSETNLEESSSQDVIVIDPQNHYGVMFKDQKLNTIQDILSCPRARTVVDTVRGESLATKCNHAAVNRVTWNPNLGSHCWLASGSNSGLLRLHCVQAFHTKRMSCWMKEFNKEKKSSSSS